MRFVLCSALLISTLAGCKKDGAKPGPVLDDAAATAQGDGTATAGAPADAATAGTPDNGETPPTDAAAAAAQPATDETGDPAEPTKVAAATGSGKSDKPTNLRVLPKSISPDDLKATMKQVSKDLGVKCDFCHDVDDWAADTNKHKDMARKMMVMTKGLNKDFFGGKQEVTCFTCHQGAKEPPH